MPSMIQNVGKVSPDDFPVAVALGKFKGWAVERKFGMNADIDAGTEDIWSYGGVRTLPAAAAQASVVSTSTSDAPAGTGARTITIEGLDENYLEITETITMNGTTPVVSTQSFLRINRSYVLTAGTNETNVGNINTSIGGNVQVSIEGGEGQTHGALYTVPANKYFVVTYISIVVNKGGNTVQVMGQIKLFGAAWRTISDLYMPDTHYLSAESVTPLPPKTEIRARATVTGSNNQVSFIVGGYLVETIYL